MKKNNKNAVDKPMASEQAIKKPPYKKWWFWTAIIAAAVIIALALATALDPAIISLGIRIACKPKDPSVPANYDSILASTEAKYDISYESANENGYFDVFYPKNLTGNRPTVVYIHGGYYIGGDKVSAEPYCRTIANEGFTVVSINYALAPEVKYPAQARQVNEAISFIIKNNDDYHVDPEQIFIGGDSAGGHLAAQIGAFYTNEELASSLNFKPAIDADSLKGVILLCGFYNMDTVGDCKFPFFNSAMWAFTGTRDYKKYIRKNEMSVVKQVTSDYPDAYITCGSDDPFYSQAEEMVACLEENRVKYVAYLPKSNENKLKHEFQRDFSLAECNEAMDKLIAFLKQRSTIDEVPTDVKAIFALDTGDTFVVRLYPQYAPASVANFIKYAEDGFYNGTVFHRVIAGQVLQGGGYVKDANGNLVQKKATYSPIKGEFAENGFTNNTLTHCAGAISMARANAFDSATSQFFFCAVDIQNYDGVYAAFGQIIEGGENLIELVTPELDGTTPVNPVTLLSVRIEYGEE